MKIWKEMTICLVTMMMMTTWMNWKVIKQKNNKSKKKIKKKIKTNNKATPMSRETK